MGKIELPEWLKNTPIHPSGFDAAGNAEGRVLVATTSMGAGGVRLGLYWVPISLHKKILEKYGDYQEMFDLGHEDDWNTDEAKEAFQLYEQVLGCERTEPAGKIIEENE